MSGNQRNTIMSEIHLTFNNHMLKLSSRKDSTRLFLNLQSRVLMLHCIGKIPTQLNTSV